MSPRYLDYELALLLAKYGKNAVLNALAPKLQLSHEELERLLKELPEKKARARSKESPGRIESIDQIIRAHPAKARMLAMLHERFLNRAFLPELRDVKRFAEDRSWRLGPLRSRPETTPELFRLLAD